MRKQNDLNGLFGRPAPLRQYIYIRGDKNRKKINKKRKEVKDGVKFGSLMRLGGVAVEAGAIPDHETLASR